MGIKFNDFKIFYSKVYVVHQIRIKILLSKEEFVEYSRQAKTYQIWIPFQTKIVFPRDIKIFNRI